MENTSLILDFLEGTLDSTKEDELFNQLNSNEGMRSELKQYVAMDKAFNKKLSTMAPSAKSTMGVFAALGLNAPIAPPPPHPAPAIVPAKVAGVFGKYSQGVLSGLLATALTTAAFLAFFGHAIFSNGNTGGIANNGLNIQQPPQVPTVNNIPVTSSKSLDNKPVVRTKIVYVPVNNQIAMNNDETSGNIPAVAVQEEVAEEKQQMPMMNESSIATESIAKPRAIIAEREFYNAIPMNFDIQPFFKSLSIYEPIGLSLAINGSQYWQLQTVPITQSSIPKFYNTGISALYQISDNFSLAADIRNEHFYQEFEGTDIIGDKFMYRQFPNYVAYSGGIKWTFLNYKSVSSYSQMMLGGTKTGMIGRGTLGLQYSPQPQFAFIIGLEGSFLRYMHQGNAFYSPKLGLNYGVIFNF